MTPEQRQQFNDLLDSQVTLFTTMRDHLKAQVEALEKGDAETLYKLVGESNQYLERAAALQHDAAPLKAVWEEGRLTIPDSEREALRLKLDGLGRIMKEVVEMMGLVNSRTHAERDETHRKLMDLQRAQAAARGYGQQFKAPGDSRFVDRNE